MIKTHKTTDFLFEIGTAELPSRSIQALIEALHENITQLLRAADIRFGQSTCYATPRRLAVLISDIDEQQLPRTTERQGPSVELAFDKDGTPTLACMSFARSCGVSADKLVTKDTPKGQRIYCQVETLGKSTAELLPDIITTAIHKLPIPKPMRWGIDDHAFVRPVHWVVALLGTQILRMKLFGLDSANTSFGHRFHHPEAILVYEPHRYEQLLKTQGHVIADVNDRKRLIIDQIQQYEKTHPDTAVIVDEKLLDEITGLVEWPVALVGHYQPEFLNIPPEALVTAMKVHQKCFPMINATQGVLIPAFLFISNISSTDPSAVIAGNERVIHARLADAAFFYHQDRAQIHDAASLNVFNQRLQGLVFEKTLGTVWDRVNRLMHISHHIVISLQRDLDVTQADSERAASLSKFDLMTQMVCEFPELQGVMGYYYAMHAGEKTSVAKAIKEHYYPRFAGDPLPEEPLGIILALADRLDLLCGIIGINKAPSADKDPYALRRAALGIVRILIEKNLPLDLKQILVIATTCYSNTLPNPEVVQQTFEFIMERLRAWYLDKGVSPLVFSAVYATRTPVLSDFDRRLKAVQHFQTLPASLALSAAHKRVQNVLKKIDATVTIPLHINEALLQTDSERHLFGLLKTKMITVERLYEIGHYAQVLNEVASLKEPVDHFFAHVMVMVDDLPLQHNRLAILRQLQYLFTLIADI